MLIFSSVTLKKIKKNKKGHRESDRYIDASIGREPGGHALNIGPLSVGRHSFAASALTFMPQV